MFLEIIIGSLCVVVNLNGIEALWLLQLAKLNSWLSQSCCVHLMSLFMRFAAVCFWQNPLWFMACKSGEPCIHLFGMYVNTFLKYLYLCFTLKKLEVVEFEYVMKLTFSELVQKHQNTCFKQWTNVNSNHLERTPCWSCDYNFKM